MLQLPFLDGATACVCLLHHSQDRCGSPPKEHTDEAAPARFPMRCARFPSKPVCLQCTTEERELPLASDRRPLGRTLDPLPPADPEFRPPAGAAKVILPQVEQSKFRE